MTRYLIVLSVWTAAAEAHIGGRLYPVYEISNEALESIDIRDGLIDEWEAIGEPTMTMLDFFAAPELPRDPSNLDFRIWLGWHGESNRIYAAFLIADDEYVNTHDWNGSGLRPVMYLHDSSIHLYFDADHSGGSGRRFEGVIDEDVLQIFGSVQRYDAIAETAGGPTLTATFLERFAWQTLPPFADAGGAVYGENPTVSVIELYVTPQDGWTPKMEDTPFSDLSANRIIGFAPIVNDRDASRGGKWSTPWYPSALPDFQAYRALFYRNAADVLLDGLLLPVRGTAVESVTWGRIKASLQ